MGVEEISTAYMNFGSTGLIIIAFFVLLIWIIKTNNAREDKLYTLIDSLAQQLPEMRESLDDIKHGVHLLEERSGFYAEKREH